MYPALKERIADSGFKQKFIAHKLGMHPTYLSQIVNGHRPPKPRDKTALAAFFGVTESMLFFDPTVN